MERLDMKKLFDELYEIMSKSKKVDNMIIFGNVLKELMDFVIEEYPGDAEGYLEELSAVKWRNYLTRSEAENIIKKMHPSAVWNYGDICNTVTSFGGDVEKDPYYNSYALWVVMNMIYSDSGETIAKILGSDINSINKGALAQSIYLLALDKLKDEDEVFSVRSYFKV